MVRTEWTRNPTFRNYKLQRPDGTYLEASSEKSESKRFASLKHIDDNQPANPILGVIVGEYTKKLETIN